MKKAAGKAAREQEIKAALEVIAGQKISPEVPLPLETFPPFLWRVGTTVRTLQDESSTIWKNLRGQTGSNTADPGLVDLTGFSNTGSDGKIVFRLMSFQNGFQVDTTQPFNVIATARGGVPVSLTVDYTPVESGDFEITVFAWDTQGNPAPNVTFDWRCRFSFTVE